MQPAVLSESVDRRYAAYAAQPQLNNVLVGHSADPVNSSDCVINTVEWLLLQYAK